MYGFWAGPEKKDDEISHGERNMMNQVESIYLGFWAAVTGAEALCVV